MSLRDATPADADAIAAIYNASIRAGDATMIDTPLTGEDIRRQMAAFTDREGYLVLEDADGIAGWAVVKRYSDRGGYRFAAETSTFIRRDRLRRGYGARLQRALLDRCRALGYHHLVARIWASNEGSIAFHRAFGYELVGIQREIGFMHGQWQDVALMQCLLDPPDGA